MILSVPIPIPPASAGFIASREILQPVCSGRLGEYQGIDGTVRPLNGNVVCFSQW